MVHLFRTRSVKSYFTDSSRFIFWLTWGGHWTTAVVFKSTHACDRDACLVRTYLIHYFIGQGRNGERRLKEHLNVQHVQHIDDRRIEVIANGLAFWGGAQLAVDTAVVSPQLLPDSSVDFVLGLSLWALHIWRVANIKTIPKPGS